MQLQDFYAIWLHRIQIRENTKVAYQSYWRNHIKPAFGD